MVHLLSPVPIDGIANVPVLDGEYPLHQARGLVMIKAHIMMQHTTVHPWQGGLISSALFLWILFWITVWQGLQTIVPSLP